jgi:hypothetical protein
VVLAEGDILQKLDVISRTEAVVKAKERGIIPQWPGFSVIAWLPQPDTCGNPQVRPVEIHSRQAALFLVH